MSNESLQEIVNRVADLAIEKRQPVSKIATNGFAKGINGKVRLELVRQGLIYLGNNELHARKTNGGGAEGKAESDTGGGPAPVLQSGHPHPRDEDDVLRRFHLATSDGRYLPVLEAPIAELRTEAMSCRGQAHGWAARADAFDFAVQSCEAAGVERLDELPAKKLQPVREQFAKIWGAT